jgi:hypothetical protein
MYSEQSQSPDVIERIGIVIWKIAVLVIALRFALALVPQHGLLDGLASGSALLQAGALVLIALGCAWALMRAVRARVSRRTRAEPVPAPESARRRIRDKAAFRSLSAAQSIQHIMWRGSNWMLALGLESMLAAQIIQVSIASAGQQGLSWWRIGLVAIIAIGRILM